MKYDDIESEIQEDSKFDITNLVSESAKTPYLFGKWNNILHREKLQLDILKNRLSVIKRKRLEYYMGYASDEEYIKNPFHLKIHRSDLETYLSSDEEYSTQYLKICAQETKVSLITQFLSGLNNRSFIINNINKTRSFEAGN